MNHQIALKNDKIRAHSNLFALDYMVQPDEIVEPACFLICAVCTWVGEHMAH